MLYCTFVITNLLYILEDLRILPDIVLVTFLARGRIINLSLTSCNPRCRAAVEGKNWKQLTLRSFLTLKELALEGAMSPKPLPSSIVLLLILLLLQIASCSLVYPLFVEGEEGGEEEGGITNVTIPIQSLRFFKV